MQETEIQKKLRESIVKAVGNKDVEVKLDHPADGRFGDYSTSVAMQLAKDEKKNPREVAGEIKDKILLRQLADQDDGIIEKVEIAGPGFINFYLKKEFLVRQAEKINFEIEFKNELSQYGRSKTMVIDYSAPNIAKPFGIGHLRSTNIGQAIYNIYKILGWNTIGDNHLGDWGTQFGKLMVAIKKWGPSTSLRLEEMTITDLEKLYVRFHAEAEKDDSLVEEGRNWFMKLEKGDKEALEIWQKCIDISIREFNQVYELLGVKIDYTLGESFYKDKWDETMALMEKKGIVKESQGAKIVEFPSLPPAMAAKTNETTTYFLRDMSTIKYRLDTWKPDLIVYEVGADQELYFRQVFAAAKMMGWKTEYYHVAHGLLRWKTGKFSTRKGDTIHLSDVIEKAREEAKKIAEKSTVIKEMTKEEKNEMVEAVAIGAIKFNDLGQDPKKDIVFDWEKIMSMEGDSGPYLQYTYARCRSVLAKTEILEQKDIENIPETINDEEMNLLKEFYKFEEKIIEASERFSPAVIAEYLLSVARKYNEFYAKHRIIGEKEETWRIFLTKTTSSTLKIGLDLLGIKTLEKM